MDNGKLYPFDVFEYVKAINNAPPGTWIGMDDFTPEQIAECTDCHAQMGWALTQFHSCQEGKA